jgi:hypothetical protein
VIIGGLVDLMQTAFSTRALSFTFRNSLFRRKSLVIMGNLKYRLTYCDLKPLDAWRIFDHWPIVRIGGCVSRRLRWASQSMNILARDSPWSSPAPLTLFSGASSYFSDLKVTCLTTWKLPHPGPD